MTIRTATCRCGQLSATCTGEPVRVSVCHCYDCQKRSGSAFAVQARFSAEAVTVCREYKVYEHVLGSGNAAHFHFAPIVAARCSIMPGRTATFMPSLSAPLPTRTFPCRNTPSMWTASMIG